MIRDMLENASNIWKPMNRLQLAIFLLTTNLSWWLMKQKNALTVSTVSRFLKLNFLEWTHYCYLIYNKKGTIPKNRPNFILTLFKAVLQ